MKKFISILAVLAVVVFVGQMCPGGDSTSTTTTPTTTTTPSTPTTTTTTTAPTVESYSMNEDAAAGNIVHNVNYVEVLNEIPMDYTLEEWEIIAESLPADAGFQWVLIEGSVTNNTNETQILDSTSVVVRDLNGNEYKVSTETTIYVEDELSPVYIEIQPTQTKPWEGYFMVPEGSTDLVLVGNDLQFVPEAEVEIDLEV